MEYEIKVDRIAKINIKPNLIKYASLSKKYASHKLKWKLWSKKSLAITVVFVFAICNSLVTAHFLSNFSFELTNDIFSYLVFIIASVFGIGIINARWIKIVAEKYANKF